MDDRETREVVARRYGEHLTDADLLALCGDRPDQVPALRSHPVLVLDLLDRPPVAEAVLRADHDRAGRFRHVSPFLVFAAAVHRVAGALVGRSHVPDRTAPRSRVPVFDGPVLAAFAADPAHRLFLAELLASYARLASGVVWRRDPQGLRRRRWDELDLPALAEAVLALPEDQRAGGWRRLGDGALFLAGVFPEYAERTYGDAGITRLAPLAGAGEGPVTELLEARLRACRGGSAAGGRRVAARGAPGAGARRRPPPARAGGVRPGRGRALTVLGPSRPRPRERGCSGDVRVPDARSSCLRRGRAPRGPPGAGARSSAGCR